MLLKPVAEECPYLANMISIYENIYIISLEEDDLETLLSEGFRHFGEVFFKPICTYCNSCISVRIPVQQFSRSKSVKRLFNRNKRFNVILEEKPVPGKEAFELYNRHKKRFKKKYFESYELYVKSFFHHFKFNRMLSIREGNKLIAVSHLDVTANTMSAVYCYFDEKYNRFSPGKFAVYKEIELAKEMGIKYLYLGYYIQQNRHTQYKILFKPNQLMVEDNKWRDYMDSSGNIINPLAQP